METVYKGVIIKESLNEFDQQKINKFVIGNHTHLLDKREPCTILYLSVPWKELAGLCDSISKCLKPNGYYIHFVMGDRMVVCFPNRIFSFERDDIKTIEKCRAFGRKIFISDRLMKFELLFNKEHPND